MLQALRQLFEVHQQNGRVVVEYDTRVYAGQLDNAAGWNSSCAGRKRAGTSRPSWLQVFEVEIRSSTLADWFNTICLQSGRAACPALFATASPNDAQKKALPVGRKRLCL